LSGLPTRELPLPNGDSRFRTALADRYRLERELGRGGMATVFLAHDLKHDRPVALKVLLPELAAALGPERFEREIKLAARLQHPHILTVHDSGEVAGQLWFTMPFVEGESLRDRLTREHQLPVEDAVRIAREAALALEYAHQHGVVHRDIKPENLLLTTDGSTMVADFGIARALGGGEQRLTSTGLAIGTAAYMSPEQASGTRDLDARTDVYALGCVLYEMLAGEPPFAGPTTQAIMARVLTETPRPIHPMRAGVPEALDAVIAKAMAVTAADRYAGAAEFARALGMASGAKTADPGLVPVPGARPRFVAAWLAPRPLFAMLVLGVLLGGGALFAWRRAHEGGPGAGATLLAVLPFENLGAPEDEYFADGMTDEVRGKLATLSGLRVIARGSSTPYKKTAKSLQQIARELGVRYLLTATVRWEKTPGGASRVHVSPELVEVEDGSSPTTKWQAPFDAALTDVFQVQADIAGRVAQALDVALGDSTRQQLAAQPTRNLAAYDAFLRGEAAAQGMASGDLLYSEPPSLRRAVTAYEQAVALDSNFVEAWAQLARVHSVLYLLSAPTPDEAESARRAAERASALAPHRPESHQAWAAYYRFVRVDMRRAFAEDSTALGLAPGSADLLSGMAAGEQRLGRWDAARAHLEQAARLDPRAGNPAQLLGVVLLHTRHYPEAQEVFDRALALAPTSVANAENRAMVALALGDLAGARTVLRAAPPAIDPTALVAYLANYWDLVWVLDDAQQALLLRLGPSAFDNARGTWAIVLTQTYALRGDSARARVYADSARLATEELLRAAPGDPQQHVLLGLALAYLGRKADAIREGQRGVALRSISQDAFVGPYFQHQLARIYLLVGEPEKALDQLEPLLRVPYFLSPGWLRIDPNFDRLRGNPRFQRLVAGGS
jgi:serine/threonine-protein kinase